MSYRGGRGWSLRKPRHAVPGLPKTPAPATQAQDFDSLTVNKRWDLDQRAFASVEG